MQDKEKTVVLVYNQQKLRESARDNDHFKDVRKRQYLYFGDRDDNIPYISKTIRNTTNIEQRLIERDLYILRGAENDGYIHVDWFKLFQQKDKNNFHVFLNNIVKSTAEIIPSILTNWNKRFETNSFKKNGYDKILTILKKPIDISNTNNDDYFLNLNDIQRIFFNNGVKNIVSNIDGSSEMELDDLVRLTAVINVIRDANSDGIIVVDWDQFFRLNQESLFSAVKSASELINKCHTNYVNDGKIRYHEVFTLSELREQREMIK